MSRPQFRCPVCPRQGVRQRPVREIGVASFLRLRWRPPEIPMAGEVGQPPVPMRGDKGIYAPGPKALVGKIAPFRLRKTNLQRILNVGPTLHAAPIGTSKPVRGPQDKCRRERGTKQIRRETGRELLLNAFKNPGIQFVAIKRQTFRSRQVKVCAGLSKRMRPAVCCIVPRSLDFRFALAFFHWRDPHIPHHGGDLSLRSASAREDPQARQKRLRYRRIRKVTRKQNSRRALSLTENVYTRWDDVFGEEEAI